MSRATTRIGAGDAIAFVERHGVVLASARGPVPRLTEAIVGGAVSGSWWSHPEGKRIFAILGTVADSKDVLVCRLVDGKVTFVHRRLWPALVRLANRFEPGRVSQVHEEHTASGRHVAREVPFPDWVPAQIAKRASALSEEDALEALGAWSRRAQPPKAVKRKERSA
jgi:hypothetical protein